MGLLLESMTSGKARRDSCKTLFFQKQGGKCKRIDFFDFVFLFFVFCFLHLFLNDKSNVLEATTNNSKAFTEDCPRPCPKALGVDG